jgi:hypothetical protein
MMEYRVIGNLKVKAHGEEKNIHPGEVVTLSDAQAARLLEAGKVVPILPSVPEVHAMDQYSEVFRLALEEVAIQDPQGVALRQIRQDSLETWAEIQSAEDKVNLLWQEAQSGQPVWTDYNQAVENWRSLFQRAIKGEKLISRLA